MRKQITATAVSLALATVLVACGSKDSSNTGASAPVAPAATTRAQAVATRAPSPERVASRIDLGGAGATQPYQLYSLWSGEYTTQVDPNVAINYQPVGNSKGRAEFLAGNADFGAHDAFLTTEQMAQGRGPIIHIPTAVYGVVVTYNLPGISGELKLTGDVMADLFMGTIKSWNDPRLAAINPGVTFPDLPIKVVYRSDSSTTTFMFSEYLSSVSPDWKTKLGASNSIKWLTGAGAEDNQGVLDALRDTPGSVGYAKYFYTEESNLPVAQVKNSAGQFVKPSLESFGAAAAAAAPGMADHLRVSFVNPTGEKSYPIAGFTWMLAYEKQSDPIKAQALTGYLWWALHDERARKIQQTQPYAPLPLEVVAKVDKLIQGITVDGTQALKLK